MPDDGYGGDHRAEGRRQRALLLNDGSDPCPRCGRAMFATPQLARAFGAPAELGRLDLGHWPGLVFGGPQVRRLEHALCNRRAGAVVGNKLRGARRRAGAPTGRRNPRPRW